MPDRRPVLAASALALALNLAGIGWGLPSRFHPDEKADVVAAMVRERRLLPDSYVNPSLPLALAAPAVAVQQRRPRLAALALVRSPPRRARPLGARRCRSRSCCSASRLPGSDRRRASWLPSSSRSPPAS